MIIYSNMCNFYHHRNAYKAIVFFLLLSSPVTWKLFANSFDNTTEQNFMYMEQMLMQKSWFPKCIIMWDFHKLEHVFAAPGF